MTTDPDTGTEPDTSKRRAVLIRGLLMLLFAALFGLAETLLFVSAVIQFFWMLFKDAPNPAIANFGKSLAKWLARVALFQTGATEDLPFPWSKWE